MDKKHNFLNNFDTSKFNKADIEAAKKGNTDALLSKLSNEEKQKLNSILNDNQAIENILKSPQAAAILKALGGKNG